MHSRFAVPLDLDEASTSMLSAQSERARVLQDARLLVLDEATMGSKDVFRVVDNLLRDLMGALDPALEHVPFGGKVVVLSGDWRQLPPVVRRGGRAATVGASLKSSAMWQEFKVLHLRTNMRVELLGRGTAAATEVDVFSKWLLDIGEGRQEKILIPPAMQATSEDPSRKRHFHTAGEFAFFAFFWINGKYIPP